MMNDPALSSVFEIWKWK